MRPVFSITLNSKDLNLLESIKNTLGAGTISQSGKSAIFAVESVKDLPLIINHFDKYPLITQKISDYLIFKQCYEIFTKNEHLTETGLLKILSLKSSLNLGLPDTLKSAFPNIKQKDRPEYFFNGIPDPFWVSGFTSGDGSFHVVDVKNKGKTTGVLARFSIHLHVRDLEVLKGLSTYFKSLNSNIESTEEKSKNIIISENSANLQISKFSDVTNILIPFFNKYPILGVKSLDFKDFQIICNLMQEKNNLNSASELAGQGNPPSTLDKILDIKSNMNLRRKIK
uniref:LAGLIDADG homing endonuclease n=1 Tax=Elmerina hispida TaxID=1245649 RepID=UPI0030021C1C|nr:LAGLIDADG homing endonuclease [Elmerina hispida]